MLNHIIDEYLAAHGENRCCWFAGHWLTRSNLLALADDATSSLKNCGFTPGQRIASLLPNSPVMLALMTATWRLGGIFCPLNDKAGAASLTKTLSLLQPFTVIVPDNLNSELEGVIMQDWPCVKTSLTGLTDEVTGRPQTADDPETAVIFSTSGTTGDPKAVPLTHANLLADIDACLAHVKDLQPGDSLLNVLPNFHAFGFTVCCVLPFRLDATQVLMTSFMPPSKVIAVIEETKPTVLLLVPTMVGFAASMLERMDKKLTGIKLLIAGGDRYNPKIDPRVTERFGTELIEGYGITECSPVLAVNPKPSVRKLGTVGPALPGFELELRTEAGEVTAIPGEGVLWVRGPAVSKGYYHAPEVSAERFIDGWFNTGDYVQIDEDGYIKILDRVTDIIIVGGFNVYPQEVEAILSEHDGVSLAVVVGMPNAISGEVPKAYVIRSAGSDVTEGELVKYCKDRLSHYKVPRSIEFVESLPISATGKILRRVLRQKERDNH